MILTKPTLALSIKSPFANGLIDPSARVAGPSPIKRRSPVPATTEVPSPRSVKLKEPSRRTISPIRREALARVADKTLPSFAPKKTLIVDPPSWIVSSTAPPVLLTERMRVPPASSPPALAARSPESVPATPFDLTTKAPIPLIRLASPSFTSTATVMLAIAIRVRFENDSKKKSPARTALTLRSSNSLRVSSEPIMAKRTNGPAGSVKVSIP